MLLVNPYGQPANCTINSSIIFWVVNSCHLVTKKRDGESNNRNFDKKSPYLKEKKLEVTRFRQCVAWD
jgi:hypothetical protein